MTLADRLTEAGLTPDYRPLHDDAIDLRDRVGEARAFIAAMEPSVRSEK